jgi:hypothetical protein
MARVFATNPAGMEFPMSLFAMLNVSAVIAATAQMRELNSPAPVVVPVSTDPRAAELAAIVDAADFGCQQANVRKLVSALAGVELPAAPRAEPASSRFTFVPGAMYKQSDGTLVFIRKLDSDDDALPIADDGEAPAYIARSAGRFGNIPTDEEITAAISA